MMKRFVLLCALALLPSAAMAQQHDHAKAKPAAAHANFVRELIAAKAELKLTDEQITKLESLSVRMDEMHAKMGEMHAKMSSAGADSAARSDARTAHAQMEGKLHADLLAVFTEAQLTKVRPMMKAHMDKTGMGEKKHEHQH